MDKRNTYKNRHDIKRELQKEVIADFKNYYHDLVLEDFVRSWNNRHPYYMELSESDINWLHSLDPRIIVTFKPRKLEMVDTNG